MGDQEVKIFMKVRLCWTACFMMISTYLFSESVCHYKDWRWNVDEKRAVQYKTVIKDFSRLTQDERDVLSGCSVCAEDQRAIKLKAYQNFHCVISMRNL